MRLENVSTGTLISIQVQVSCQSCKCIHETEAIKEPDSEYLINNDKCPKCGQKSRLVAKQGTWLYLMKTLIFNKKFSMQTPMQYAQ